MARSRSHAVKIGPPRRVHKKKQATRLGLPLALQVKAWVVDPA